MSITVGTVLCPSLGTGFKSFLEFRWGTQKFVAEICNVVPILHSCPGESASRLGYQCCHLTFQADISLFVVCWWCLDAYLADLHPISFADIHAAITNVRSWHCFTDIRWRSSCAVRSSLLPISSGEVMKAAGFGNYRAKRSHKTVIFIWELVHFTRLSVPENRSDELESEEFEGIWKEAVL